MSNPITIYDLRDTIQRRLNLDNDTTESLLNIEQEAEKVSNFSSFCKFELLIFVSITFNLI